MMPVAKHKAIATAFLLLGCASEMPGRSPPPPLPSDAEFLSRESCLYRTTCQMVMERGTSPIELDGIGVSATAVCSRDLHTKIIEHYRGQDGFDITVYDTLNTQRHAVAIATEQAKICARKS